MKRHVTSVVNFEETCQWVMSSKPLEVQVTELPTLVEKNQIRLT